MSLILGTVVAVVAGRKLGDMSTLYILGTDVLSAEGAPFPDVKPVAKSFATSVVAGLVVAALVA